MSVTITKQQQTAPQTWRLSWSSDLVDPTFYVYQNGILLNATLATYGDFQVTPGAQLQVEVLDSASQAPTAVYSGTVELGWYQTPATASYKIEQWIGSAWSQVDSVPDVGAWWVSWTSAYLPDCAAYQFRVTPIGKNGNPGTAQIFNGFIVRIPDAPAANFTLNTDTTVTIS